ncbi:MAG: folate-binding protein [Cycloclasticus sp.]|nr:folate-binding protein [Cycloclasticus sp.]
MILYDLNTSTSIISFSGVDAAQFLQGQVTCDVLALNHTGSAFGALCNPKGRVITLFRVCKLEETFYLLLPKEMSENVIKRLKMFVFRSKVQIEDVSDQYAVIGMSESLQNKQLEPLTPLAQIRLSDNDDLNLFITTLENYQQIIKNPTVTLNSNPDDWQQLMITACIPEIGPISSEKFVPQVINLDLLHALNFKKGCYTGQEIVARMHYKGTIKRRLVIYHSTDERAAGEELFILDDANSIGTILNCIVSDKGGYTGLVVLKTPAIDNETLALKNGDALIIVRPHYDLQLA